MTWLFEPVPKLDQFFEKMLALTIMKNFRRGQHCSFLHQKLDQNSFDASPQ
jgi:hypothetical protein